MAKRKGKRMMGLLGTTAALVLVLGNTVLAGSQTKTGQFMNVTASCDPPLCFGSTFNYWSGVRYLENYLNVYDGDQNRVAYDQNAGAKAYGVGVATTLSVSNAAKVVVTGYIRAAEGSGSGVVESIVAEATK